MPVYFFVLFSHWPVLPIAFMDLSGVGPGIVLYARRGLAANHELPGRRGAGAYAGGLTAAIWFGFAR